MFGEKEEAHPEMMEEKKAGGGMRQKLIQELIEMLMQMPEGKTGSVEVAVEAEPGLEGKKEELG